VSDQVDAYGAPGATLTWPLHGNGGETSGGTYDQGTAGGTWTRGGARLTSAIAVPGAAPDLTTRAGTHERPGNIETLHTVLEASAPAERGGAVQVLYPSRIGDIVPSVETSAGDPTPWVRVVAPSDDRILTSTRPAPEPTDEPTAPARAAIDGVAGGTGLLSVDRRTDGTLRSAWADDTTELIVDGGPTVQVDAPGSLGIAVDPATAGRVEVVATGTSPRIMVTGLGFTPTAADGACGFEVDPATGTVTVEVGRERRVVLRTGPSDTRPAADAGAGAGGRVTAGATVTLDGSGSCDADGGTLSHRWELVSAPAGSAWSLTGTTTASPTLTADVVGPYRVRLVVTDDEGNRSAEQEVLVIAGPRCGDGVDNDLDGRIDTDDADCDGPEPPPPTTTTTSTTTTTTTTSTSIPTPTTSIPTPTTVPQGTTPGALPAEARRGSARYTG
jgi:hypothetical protein